MTIQELISELQTYDPRAQVWIRFINEEGKFEVLEARELKPFVKPGNILTQAVISLA